MGRVEADEHGVVWLIDAEGVRYQLAVVFQGGWRIVETTPAERTLLSVGVSHTDHGPSSAA